jgi:hypothetical protein
VKDVTRVSGTMTMMRVWLLRTLTNEASNTMRAMERTGKGKTSSVVLSQESASSVKAQMTKATMPEVRGKTSRFKHSSQSVVRQFKERGRRITKRRRR